MFILQPLIYRIEESQVLFIISWLRGTIVIWALEIAENENHSFRHDYTAFKEAITMVYRDRITKITASNKLMNLKQTKSIIAYAVEFQDLCTIFVIESNSRMIYFYNDLHRKVKRGLALCHEPKTFYELSQKAII